MEDSFSEVEAEICSAADGNESGCEQIDEKTWHQQSLRMFVAN